MFRFFLPAFPVFVVVHLVSNFACASGLDVQRPYEPKDSTQVKRYQAQQKFGTTYVHDYIDLFQVALEQRWAAYRLANPGVEVPEKPVHHRELVLNRHGKLVEDKRHAGLNDIGMVAWRLTLQTPEYPDGRDIILIVNDITIVNGSFSPKEDELFLKASELARSEHIPRLYISVNSGARIGYAKEVLARVRLAWISSNEPWKGFRYMYLTPEDYKWAVDKQVVSASPIEESGETRFKITAVFGSEDGIGVENLKGSGAIAGETSLSYKENMTMTIVACRSVGIGAYLVRLGQRTIQAEHSHIILTGHGAINKLLGKDVYSSSLQLGGPQIMYANGISHMTSINDFDGIRQAINWLSFVPRTRKSPVPILLWNFDDKGVVHAPDTPNRSIDFVPSPAAYDPRWLIAGHKSSTETYDYGFFDRGSFMETLGGWAKTVVTGRARLGGIPVGVIAVETRAVELLIPADPANPSSVSSVTHQAGQVWYPDSAYKTATAIRDMDGEDLPLFIMANWRGFSGGMRDMYDQVLKFGAMIVDALREYHHPVFVYLPPNSELRGGAWVVVDPSINSDMMEMYADPESRGGVLEPEGLVAVKFRRKVKEETMYRLDEKYRSLKDALKNKDISAEEKKQLAQSLSERYDLLHGIYHQFAVQFADLHDRPARMKHKNCIRDVIPWAKARNFFYWRLRRRLAEERIRKEILASNPQLSRQQSGFIMRRWFFDVKGPDSVSLWEDNEAVAVWFASNMDAEGSLAKNSAISRGLRAVRAEGILQAVKDVTANASSETALEAIGALMEKLSPEHKEKLVQGFSQVSSS